MEDSRLSTWQPKCKGPDLGPWLVVGMGKGNRSSSHYWCPPVNVVGVWVRWKKSKCPSMNTPPLPQGTIFLNCAWHELPHHQEGWPMYACQFQTRSSPALYILRTNTKVLCVPAKSFMICLTHLSAWVFNHTTTLSPSLSIKSLPSAIQTQELYATSWISPLLFLLP